MLEALDVLLSRDGLHVGQSVQRRGQAQRSDVAVQTTLGAIGRPLTAGGPDLLALHSRVRFTRCS